MVNLKPPAAPDMVEVGGQLYRPEDVEAAEARLAAREGFPAGAVDPTPIGVARSTDNRRRTLRELNAEAGETVVDPASSILAREGAADVGVPVEADADPVVTATASGERTRPTRKRASASDAGE
jgi:hypothetical protein